MDDEGKEATPGPPLYKPKINDASSRSDHSIAYNFMVGKKYVGRLDKIMDKRMQAVWEIKAGFSEGRGFEREKEQQQAPAAELC